MLVELHAHSHHSEGRQVKVEGLHSVEQMLKHAKKIGLKALAITDHDSLKGGLEARKKAKKLGLIGIAGQEINSAEGHVIGLGLQEFIEPGLSVEETIGLIHRQAGISIAPHPFDIYGKGVKEKAIYCDAVESFNAFNLDRTSNYLAERFCKKHELIRLSGSDAHFKEGLGIAATKLLVEADDEDDVLKAVKKGLVQCNNNYGSVTALRDWSIKRLRKSYPFVLNYIEENYSHPKKLVAKKLLSIARKDNLASKALINCFAYSGYGIVLSYGLLKPLIK